MSILSHLSPAAVWVYFEEICKIPRLSKNEEKIRRYLLDFASANNLKAKEDETGNILITREASPGMEGSKTLVLQSHMDMVGEKNAGHPHNWTTDPIVPQLKGEWVTASGTTLGADDGIGIASQMAILTDKDLVAGRIECLFTVDEESGMTGALNLDPGFFEGRTLINLDSEDEGILFIGCAGGLDTVGTLKAERMETAPGSQGLAVSVTGLRGGHSGDEIHKGFGNSVKIMNRLLLSLSEKFSIGIDRFDAGNLRNAIPREAFATIAVDGDKKNMVTKEIASLSRMIRDEFGDLEKDLKISVEETDTPATLLNEESRKKLLEILSCCPHGVLAWSKEMEDLVETSTNLASVKFVDEDLIKIVTTQRSSVEPAKHEAAGMVRACLSLAGAEVLHSDGYPGWEPSLKSEILRLTRESYVRLFGREPLVRAIHAGLECGLIFRKYPGIDMISFGPTIRGAHTPEEKIDIKTVAMFWDLLTDVIRSVSSVK
ncbi:MAG: aminoacyl-histidine dipeptidase [Bacteroidales bacterium]|jgi:dipeptidase D|nr:aminoacyl-histidine dipeptidase [Bacteroidales bacterium]